MNTDELYIKRCLELATLGIGKVEPGALVGCVIVHSKTIIGEGYYFVNGGEHAEIVAISDVSDKTLLSDSTLYVSLEPCDHFGKTPPCTNAIIEAGIKKVVICNLDSNPKVAGAGVKKLKDAGIEVSYGILEDEGEYINRRFLNFHNRKKPYIILKWAESKDGFFAPNELIQRWITGEESRILTHKWRSEESAILIGKNTVLADNPNLTLRAWSGPQPTRLFIDKMLEVPSDYNIYSDDSSTWTFNSEREETSGHIKYVKIDFKKEIIPQILQRLYEDEIQSVIIEGGIITLNSFIEQNLWDEARIISGHEIWGSGRPAPKISGTLIAEDKIAKDSLKIILNRP